MKAMTKEVLEAKKAASTASSKVDTVTAKVTVCANKITSLQSTIDHLTAACVKKLEDF